MKERVNHILEEYRLHEHRDEFTEAFQCIKNVYIARLPIK